MTSSTTKIDKAALGEENNVTAAGHEVAVDLGLDVLDRFSILLQPRNVDLNVEMSDI